MKKLLTSASLVLLLAGCNQSEKVSTQMSMQFVLMSDAFKNNEAIPKEHTCDGANVSPQLTWKHAPAGTTTFALICDDPDAPTPEAPGPKPFVHWLIYNIPVAVTSLDQGVPTTEQINFHTEIGAQGTNDKQQVGYFGPCPPSGVHRYRFTLYALDSKLALKPAATREEFDAAMKGHILGSCQLVGTYQRKK